MTRAAGTYVLNYPGDVTEHMHPGQQFAADGGRLIQNPPYGFPLQVESSTHDPDADRTRVVLVPAVLPRSGGGS